MGEIESVRRQSSEPQLLPPTRVYGLRDERALLARGEGRAEVNDGAACADIMHVSLPSPTSAAVRP